MQVLRKDFKKFCKILMAHLETSDPVILLPDLELSDPKTRANSGISKYIKQLFYIFIKGLPEGSEMLQADLLGYFNEGGDGLNQELVFDNREFGDTILSRVAYSKRMHPEIKEQTFLYILSEMLDPLAKMKLIGKQTATGKNAFQVLIKNSSPMCSYETLHKFSQSIYSELNGDDPRQRRHMQRLWFRVFLPLNPRPLKEYIRKHKGAQRLEAFVQHQLNCILHCCCDTLAMAPQQARYQGFAHRAIKDGAEANKILTEKLRGLSLPMEEDKIRTILEYLDTNYSKIEDKARDQEKTVAFFSLLTKLENFRKESNPLEAAGRSEALKTFHDKITCSDDYRILNNGYGVYEGKSSSRMAFDAIAFSMYRSMGPTKEDIENNTENHLEKTLNIKSSYHGVLGIFGMKSTHRTAIKGILSHVLDDELPPNPNSQEPQTVSLYGKLGINPEENGASESLLSPSNSL